MIPFAAVFRTCDEEQGRLVITGKSLTNGQRESRAAAGRLFSTCENVIQEKVIRENVIEGNATQEIVIQGNGIRENVIQSHPRLLGSC